MTQDYDATSTPTPAETATAESPSAPARPEARAAQGRTRIADAVVAKIAVLATREIPGVYALGEGMSRTLGALRPRLPDAEQPAQTSQGVSVEVGEAQCAVDIDLVTHYGRSIIEVATAVRRNVISRIENMTGLEVTEVNITVDDLHVEDGSEQPELEPPRSS